MRPCDIYAMPDIARDWQKRDFYMLLNEWHNHLPEIKDTYSLYEIPLDSPMEIKVHFDAPIDYERCCIIGSVWFDNQPIMIFRHAGRGGHDDYDRFITDPMRFGKLVAYIQSLIPNQAVNDYVDAGLDLKALDRFYGYDFKGDK